MKKRRDSERNQQNFHQLSLEAIVDVEAKLQQAFSLSQEGKTQ